MKRFEKLLSDKLLDGIMVWSFIFMTVFMGIVYSVTATEPTEEIVLDIEIRPSEALEGSESEETAEVERLQGADIVAVKETPADPTEVTNPPTEPPVEYFDVPLSEDLQDHIFAVCESYDIDPAIVMAIIERESNFNPNCMGDSGRSYGLMQIQLKWHKGRMDKLDCDDLSDPYQNILVGVDYLAELLDYGKGLEWALMAYNGGPGYANKKAAAGEISKYASGVIARAEVLG